MYNFKCWRSTLLIALSITPFVIPAISIPSPSFAQRNLPREVSATIPAGTRIPIKYQAAQRIMVASDEPGPIPLTLIVARDIITPQPSLLIPAGTQVVGELVTIQEFGSAQFVAKQLVLSDGKILNIRASSPIISRTQRITKSPRLSRILANTALGTGAAAAITAVSEDVSITSGQVLLNSGFGSTPELIGRFRNQEIVRLISIEPERDLTLTLNADLILRGRASS